MVLLGGRVKIRISWEKEEMDSLDRNRRNNVALPHTVKYPGGQNRACVGSIHMQLLLAS
jgi:hypothetical protein